jgi:hypothetical protein
MFRRVWIKKIKGKVCLDPAGDDGSRESGYQHIRGVVVRLYRLIRADNKINAKDISIYEKHLVAETATDKAGTFMFYAVEGRYTVEIDPDTLPRGRGVLENKIYIDTKSDRSIDFLVRDINSIELFNPHGQVFAGEYIDLNPVLKDRAGNILQGSFEISSRDSEIVLNKNRIQINNMGYGSRKIDLCINAGTVKSNFSLQFKAPPLADPIQRVRWEFENGIIDEGTKILNYLYTLFDKNRLTGINNSRVPLKSGTTAVKEIFDYIRSENADENIVKKAERYLLFSIPKLEKTYVNPSGYFHIHYTTRGKDGVPGADSNRNGVPDYIEFMGSIFEHAKEVTCGTRGFNSPILEEGKNSFDINVYNLDGKYGLTYPLTVIEEDKHKKRRASCCICMDNNYSREKGFKIDREGCVKVTAAHEFFHAVQYAYNVDSDTWWKEASATWNEDEIYDGVNEYLQYLKGVFSSPYKSLEKNSYGGVVFAKCLSEKYGDYSIIKRIWELQGTKYNSSISAIDAAVREKFSNKGMGTVFDDYTASNFNPAQYYREGNLWREKIHIKSTFDSYPVSEQRGELNHLAAEYLLFKPLDTEKDRVLRLSVSGKEAFKLGLKILRKRVDNNLCDKIEISSNNYNDGLEFICQGFGKTYGEICFIPASLDLKHDGTAYGISAVLDNTGEL